MAHLCKFPKISYHKLSFNNIRFLMLCNTMTTKCAWRLFYSSFHPVSIFAWTTFRFANNPPHKMTLKVFIFFPCNENLGNIRAMQNFTNLSFSSKFISNVYSPIVLAMKCTENWCAKTFLIKIIIKQKYYEFHTADEWHFDVFCFLFELLFKHFFPLSLCLLLPIANDRTCGLAFDVCMIVNFNQYRTQIGE